MIQFELEDREADYLVTLLTERPLRESLNLYLKLGQQVKQQQEAKMAPLQDGPQARPNGADATAPAPKH